MAHASRGAGTFGASRVNLAAQCMGVCVCVSLCLVSIVSPWFREAQNYLGVCSPTLARRAPQRLFVCVCVCVVDFP